jgi:hypothetical protein
MPARAGTGTTGAGNQGPGTGNSISLGGHPAATRASDAAPNGEALVRVVVVGLGLQAIEDGVEGAGGKQRNEAKS